MFIRTQNIHLAQRRGERTLECSSAALHLLSLTHTLRQWSNNFQIGDFKKKNFILSGILFDCSDTFSVSSLVLSAAIYGK